MRIFALILALLAFVETSVAQKNVIWVISDDLNTMINSYGYTHAITPNIDRFAQMGVKFERAYCQQAYCGPSRTCMMSGLYPWTTGVADSGQGPWARDVMPDRVFLAEHFHNNGYYTASFGKVDHWGDGPRSWDLNARPPTYGLITGIHGYVWPGMTPRPAEQLAWRTPSLVVWASSGDMQIQAWDSPDDQFIDGQATVRAIDTMRDHIQSGSQQPFFVALGLFNPHEPAVVPKQYLDLYDVTQIPVPVEPPLAEQDVSFWQEPAFTRNWLPSATHEQRQTWIRSYLASVSYMDACFGRILQFLDDEALWDDTIVVFCSDHGYMRGEHEVAWNKQRLWEQCLRIPMIMWKPGAQGHGQSCPRTVELVDLYPTLADAADLPLPDQHFDGESFVPLLDDPGQPWPHLAYAMKPWSAYWQEPAGRVLTKDQWRYEEWVDGTRALYDLSVDTQQLTNLMHLDPPDSSMLALGDSLAAEFPAAMAMDLQSFYRKTRPPNFVPDRDADGLLDMDELDLYGTLPNDADTDDDGVTDGVEADLLVAGFDPVQEDSARLLLLHTNSSVLGFIQGNDQEALRFAGGKPLLAPTGPDTMEIRLALDVSTHLEDWQGASTLPEVGVLGDVDWPTNHSGSRGYARFAISGLVQGDPPAPPVSQDGDPVDDTAEQLVASLGFSAGVDDTPIYESLHSYRRELGVANGSDVGDLELVRLPSISELGEFRIGMQLWSRPNSISDWSHRRVETNLIPDQNGTVSFFTGAGSPTPPYFRVNLNGVKPIGGSLPIEILSDLFDRPDAPASGGAWIETRGVGSSIGVLSGHLRLATGGNLVGVRQDGVMFPFRRYRLVYAGTAVQGGLSFIESTDWTETFATAVLNGTRQAIEFTASNTTFGIKRTSGGTDCRLDYAYLLELPE